MDKIRVAWLRQTLLGTSIENITSNKVSQPLSTYLIDLGFSPSFISAFFRPFYQGIFLAPLQEQSAAMFSFVFSMFAAAPASLPALGIGTVSHQLSDALPSSSVDIRLNTRVSSVASGHVVLDDKQRTRLEAPVVVVATEGPEADRLLQANVVASSRGSICLYFWKNGSPPLRKPLLVLNGDESDGPVNNMFFPSAVAPSYAPAGKTLISATIVGDELSQSNGELETAVRSQMSRWYGKDEVASWKYLKTYRIPHSQTPQNPDFSFDRDVTVDGGLFVCGDHRRTPTVNGAIASGHDAAYAAINYFDKSKPLKQK